MTTTSIGTKLGLRKITARIGAEVTGVSPSLELDPDTVTAVRAALSEHKALVFRGIDVDDDGQQRFARYFGPLTSAHPTVPAVDGETSVLPVGIDGQPSYSVKGDASHYTPVATPVADGRAPHHAPCRRA
jgi:alpha-ketoglutarate-dependent taurine dioxygenase